MKTCEVHRSFKNSFGYHAFYDMCGKKAKFKVSYDPIPGNKRVTQFMCGTHKESTRKASLRVNRIVGTDISKLKIELLTSDDSSKVDG